MKHCPICGMENIENAAFCKSCGTKFGEMIKPNDQPMQTATNQGTTLQYYGQPYPYALQHPSKNMKPIIAVAVIGIAAILVVALLFMGGVFTGGFISETDGSNNNSSSGRIAVSGGPKANLQSIATGGNALTTPAESHTAVYRYYMSGTRIGSISFTNIGEEYYQGELCNQIVGSGSFNFEIYSYSIGMSFDIEGYETTYDSTLRYCDYDFTVSYDSYSIDMQAIVEVDKYNNEITSTVSSSMTGTISTVITVSDDFWTKTNLQDNLYVGYINEVSYTASVSGYDTAVLLRISVTGQEDVTVEKGTFEDCFVVKIEQMAGVTTTTSYMWIDENDVCPKMQISNSAAALGYGDLIIELEEYYTT